MGIIAKQASKNAGYTMLGLVFGAINTIVVLPLAFADFTSGWGVIRFILSWAIIGSQLFSFGANSIALFYLPKMHSERKKSDLMRFLFRLSLVGIGVMSLLLFFGHDALVDSVDEADRALFSDYFPHLYVLSVAMVYSYLFGAYSIAHLKSTVFTLLNDTYLKGTYLLIALAYWFDVIAFSTMVAAIVGTYVIMTLILYLMARADGMRPIRSGTLKDAGSVREGISGTTDVVIKERGGRTTSSKGQSKMRQEPSRIKEFLVYGAYNILDKGSQSIVQNLDIIMVGMMLDLAGVAEYTIAFFIGSVVLIPFRSMTAIANPLISGALSKGDLQTMSDIDRNTALYGLVAGGMIFCCVWLSVDDLFTLLPDKFYNGRWVVLFIALSSLATLSAGVSSAIIVYSDRFRKNMVFNLCAIILTIITNYLFIGAHGMNGAAAATAITAAAISLARIIYVRRHFRISPFSRSFFLVAVVQFAALLLVGLVPLGIHPLVDILIRSALFCLLFALSIFRTGILHDMYRLLTGKDKLTTD